ncbi:MAG: SMP-30/gluconolactonase/LRE family protein [Acidimicrobiia bacterium]|nr:SMP-30/gluconolactonase/LRE family protein [Acidimicrobiia bacterium]
MATNPIDGFVVDPAEIRYIGHDLQRPECILAERNGTLWAADARGGVVKIDTATGEQELISQSMDQHFARATDDAARFTEGTLPNGMAFARNGDLLVSNFGTDCLELMTRSGETRVLYDSVDGERIGKVNFVIRDSQDRIWITVSTMIPNWMEAVSPKVSDGRILLVDRTGIRVVADGLAFTNEIRLDADEAWMYIAETTGRRVSRMRVQPDGSLTDYEIHGPSDTGGLIDGIAFDAFGNLWGTHVMTDRIFAITPDGDFRVILDDDDGSAAGEELMAAFERDEATPELMLAAGGTIAPWTASVTFGGEDLRTVYIGSLRGTTIPYFRSPSAGLPMVHWNE